MERQTRITIGNTSAIGTVIQGSSEELLIAVSSDAGNAVKKLVLNRAKVFQTRSTPHDPRTAAGEAARMARMARG